MNPFHSPVEPPAERSLRPVLPAGLSIPPLSPPTTGAADLMYTRADALVMLEVLESVVPPRLRSGRFKATDKLIASLQGATIMRSKKPSK